MHNLKKNVYIYSIKNIYILKKYIYTKEVRNDLFKFSHMNIISIHRTDFFLKHKKQ